MRDIARKFASRHRIAWVALSALATIATAAALAPAAMAVTNPVTIKTAFENSPISLNTSDAVGYAFTNTSTAAQTVTFTDTLPAGVTFDSPIGTTVTSGSSTGCSVVNSTAAPGASSATVTITVPNATSTVCTLSYSVVASAPSSDAAISDTYSSVSTASGAKVSTTVGSIKVLSNPSLSFTAPSAGQSFYLGQSFNAAFSCSTTDSLDSIDSFFGTDDEGNQIQSGAPIDTIDPGTHTLEVDCYSAAGGGDVTQSVSYNVGSYTLAAIKEAKTTDYVSFRTLVPAGRIGAEVIYGKKVIGTTSTSVTARGTASVKIKPTTAGKKLLAAVKGKSVAVKLQVSFTPQAIGTGDAEITPAGATVVTKNIKLPIAHATKKAKKLRVATHH